MPSHSRAALVFGGITVVAGISGTLAGSELSKFLGRYTKKAEAYVCSLSLLVGTPLLFLALNILEIRLLPFAWVRAPVAPRTYLGIWSSFVPMSSVVLSLPWKLTTNFACSCCVHWVL